MNRKDQPEGTVVLKFGGASVSSPEHFSKVAAIIAKRAKAFERTVVVVSAMAKMTDKLIELAKAVNPSPPHREYDMLVSVGERISIALLSMALAKVNIHAVSFTGSQSGIITSQDHTEAKIIDVKPWRLEKELDAGKIAIVAGFQGVSTAGEITTLGRGGSDTTAVAMAIALKATRVEFYKDVLGIYSSDPKKDPQAKLLNSLSFSEAAELMQSEKAVLHPRCIHLAEKNLMPLQVKSFLEADEKGTTVFKAASKLKQSSYEEIKATCQSKELYDKTGAPLAV